MIITGNQTLTLSDATGRVLGVFLVEESEPGLLLGQFSPGADYDAVRPLFEAFAEAVENQTLSLADELAKAIAALGILLPDGTPVHDVQIYPDGGASFRLPAGPDRNGTVPPG